MERFGINSAKKQDGHGNAVTQDTRIGLRHIRVILLIIGVASLFRTYRTFKFDIIKLHVTRPIVYMYMFLP